MKSRAKGTPADITRAREALSQAQTVEQLRQAIAVLLPLDYGLSLEQTAQILGHSIMWTSRLRNRFLSGDVYDAAPRRGGRFNQHMTEEQEYELIAPYIAQANSGRILDAKKIKTEIETVIGSRVALSTIYKMLRRHGWSSGRVRSCYKKNPADAGASEKTRISLASLSPNLMDSQRLREEGGKPASP